MGNNDQLICRRTKTIKALRFTIIAEAYECWVDFSIYELDGWTLAEDELPRWHKAGSDVFPDPVSKIEQAARYLHGSIKWDGCSDWYFDEQERAMLHACEKSDLERISNIMVACWDWMAELCPTWDY